MKKIKLLDDPSLRKICEPVTDEEDLSDLLNNMHQVMLDKFGIGLAANQIGVCKRVFILKEDQHYSVFINPEIVSLSEDVIDFDGEGCLSIPGTSATTKRHKTLKLRWKDEQGKINEMEFTGIKSIAIQHEMDHLNGKLYIDQLGPLRRKFIIDKFNKINKRML